LNKNGYVSTVLTVLKIRVANINWLPYSELELQNRQTPL